MEQKLFSNLQYITITTTLTLILIDRSISWSKFACNTFWTFTIMCQCCSSAVPTEIKNHVCITECSGTIHIICLLVFYGMAWCWPWIIVGLTIWFFMHLVSTISHFMYLSCHFICHLISWKLYVEMSFTNLTICLFLRKWIAYCSYLWPLFRSL